MPGDGAEAVAEDYENTSLSGFSRDEIDRAALRLIHGRIPHCYPSYLGGTVRACDNALDIINDIRKEYENYSPPIMRQHVMKWLRYYENDIKGKRTDCETQRSKREYDARQETRHAEEDRIEAVLETLQNN